MKKISLLLVTLLCSINFYGQAWDNSKPDNRFTIGVRVGANMSTIGGGEYDSDFKSKWGFNGGLNVNVNIYKSFAIETGVYYSAKGFKWDYEILGSYYKNPNLQYLQMPLLALLRLYMTDETHIQLKAGGYMGYLINKPESLYVKKPDLGIIVGAGVNYKKFYLGVQYELGLYEISGDDKNRNLAISLGYDF